MTAATTDPAPGRPIWIQFAVRHWPLWIGLLLLSLPSFYTLQQQVWATDFGAQGPIILFTSFWLLYRARSSMAAAAEPGAIWITAAAAGAGLVSYVFGRAYDFLILEMAGLYLIVLAALHAAVGLKALRRAWFPLLYLAFAIPMPNWLINGLTIPLKGFVSSAATSVLSAFGIPIVNEGVTLVVAQYELLVKDACSGMNSLIGLSAVSLLYIYLLHNASWRYALVLMALVVPIAILANVLRIMVLVLITYYMGDQAAQGFLHETAGLFLFTTTLVLIFGLDHLLAPLLNRGQHHVAA